MRVRLTVMAKAGAGHFPDDKAAPPDCLSPPTGLPSIGTMGYVPALLMRIGVPKETAAGEHRVWLVPEVVSRLEAKGLEIVVQHGAGADALVPDAAFTDSGAQGTEDAGQVWSADLVVTTAPPDPEQIRGLGSGSILIGFLAPLSSPQTTRALADAGATAFAMEAIPRISRAQSMDALSSQANVAGYKSALLGAEE